MYISAISQVNPNKTSYPCKKQSFKAMSLGKPSPIVTPKIRQLAETATDILENMKDKRAFETVVNGVKVNHTRARFAYMEHEHIELTKKIDNKMISANLQIHPNYGTSVTLEIPTYDHEITKCLSYESNNSDWSDFAEKLTSYMVYEFSHFTLPGCRLTDEDVKMFEKYLGEMLADADEIKKIF